MQILGSTFLTIRFVWNFLDLSSSALTITVGIIILGDFRAGTEVLIMAAITCFLLWIKLFYYMRIFKPTSSFIRMILEMFKDIRVFIYIFYIAILAFANLYYILDKGNDEKILGDLDSSYWRSYSVHLHVSSGRTGKRWFLEHRVPRTLLDYFLWFNCAPDNNDVESAHSNYGRYL